MKRFRRPIAKDDELLVKYGKDDCGDLDLIYCWPDNDTGMKHDSRLLMFALERSDVLDGKPLVKILEERGYDITTLKLTIKKKT